MPSWFSKVFKGSEAAKPAAPTAPQEIITFELDEDESKAKKPRRVINAPVLVQDDETSGWSDHIAIKVKIDEATETGLFLVDRPLLEGHSFYAADRAAADGKAPLASALFDLDSVAQVTLHGMTLTVRRGGRNNDPWETWAKNIAEQLRAHLKSGLPVVDPAWLDEIPAEDEIRTALQRVIDTEINPGIAAHSGNISIARIQGNTVYIKMGGGCQGCAASSITLRQGVEQSFRAAVPKMGALLDETDHASGQNPYFNSLPAGMRA